MINFFTKKFYYKVSYQVFNVFKLTDFVEGRKKSSHYGLYTLGFTCATRVKTESSYRVNLKQIFKNYQSSN